MIIGPNFVWLHLPKTGATSTEAFLRKKFVDQLDVHADEYNPERIIWHQSITQRIAEDPSFSVDGRRVICGFRRLPAWIISRVCYEAHRSPHHLASREMIETGHFFENDGKINSGDTYLREYRYPRVDNWLRCEHLAEDISEVFNLSFEDVQRNLQLKNQTVKISKTLFWLTVGELKRLYESNPLWAELEKELYGDLELA